MPEQTWTVRRQWQTGPERATVVIDGPGGLHLRLPDYVAARGREHRLEVGDVGDPAAGLWVWEYPLPAGWRLHLLRLALPGDRGGGRFVGLVLRAGPGMSEAVTLTWTLPTDGCDGFWQLMPAGEEDA